MQTANLEGKDETGSTIPIGVVKPINVAGSMSSETVGPAEANPPAKLSPNIDEVIPVLAQNIHLLSAQLAACQASLAQFQNQVQAQPPTQTQTQPQISENQQLQQEQQQQQSPIGNKPKNSVALPVIPQAILTSRRQNIEESHDEDSNQQKIQDPIPLPAPPAPPPMIDLTPTATALILPKKSPNDPGSSQESEDGTAKKDTSAVLLASLNERMNKSGFGLKKTAREPKEEKKEDSEKTASFQFTLRKTRKETDSATSKKDANEKSNPILEQLTQVKLKRRENVTTEPNSTDEKVDAAVTTSPMEKSEEENSSETFNFKKQLKSPIQNPKPSTVQVNITKKLDEKAEPSVQFSTLRIKRTTSFQEKSSQSTSDVDDNGKTPMVEHIKKMMMRRRSQIYEISTATSTDALENAAHREASDSIINEDAATGEIHANVKADPESNLEGSLADFVDFKNEICHNKDDTSVFPVQKKAKKRTMKPGTDLKLESNVDLKPTNIDNISVPKRAPPVPRKPQIASSSTGKGDVPIATTETTIKYSEKKTCEGDRATTTTTQSFFGSTSSSSFTDGVQCPDATKVCKTEDKLSPTPPLSPISINEVKAEIPSDHKIGNIPIPPAPPLPPKSCQIASSPTGKENVPITKNEMTIKYNEKKTIVEDHSTTTTTQSFSGSTSSSGPAADGLQRPDALLNAIKSFSKEKLKSISSNKKKMNSSYDRMMTSMMNSMMASTLADRGRAFHGDGESDSEDDVKSMDEDEWEE